MASLPSLFSPNRFPRREDDVDEDAASTRSEGFVDPNLDPGEVLSQQSQRSQTHPELVNNLNLGAVTFTGPLQLGIASHVAVR